MKENTWNSFDPGESLSPKLHHKVWKPVVTAVHGFCAGGAQYFLNESDIIICSEDALFFDPHANVGIVSSLEPVGMLHRGMPLGDVLRWALMGNEERITAPTALRLGLVTEVVTRAALRERAREIALSIPRRNPKAIQGTIRAIWESLDLTRDGGAAERVLLHADRQLSVESAGTAGQVGDPVPLILRPGDAGDHTSGSTRIRRRCVLRMRHSPSSRMYSSR